MNDSKRIDFVKEGYRFQFEISGALENLIVALRFRVNRLEMQEWTVVDPILAKALFESLKEAEKLKLHLE